jgi:hypothetical protein
MKDNDSAFSVFEEAMVHFDGSPCTDYILTSPGMTLPQYAAIKLQVPRSGNPDLDAMIRESRRADFAEKALAGMMSHGYIPEDRKQDWRVDIAQEAYELSDAMLAEWEKEHD